MISILARKQSSNEHNLLLRTSHRKKGLSLSINCLALGVGICVLLLASWLILLLKGQVIVVFQS